MKNFVISFLLMLILSYALQLFVPWWSIAIVAVLIGFSLMQHAGLAFLSGFLAVFVLWAGYAYVLSSANNHLLASKVAELMAPLTGGSKNVLFLLSGVIGGLVGGLGCLTGNLAAKLKA
jgi:hypothetical protein